MINKLFITLLILFSALPLVLAQKIIKAESIVAGESGYNEGRVTIVQNPAIDTLLTRHIIANRLHGGFDGFRIQVYSGSNRSAREESADAISEFISEFPDIKYTLKFDRPNFFKVRAGNYRTKRDALEDYLKIRKKFPNAYLVPDIIEFPDLEE